ncbi:MAG: type I DNA topoisomerase [Patescibacteria group bacterium]
MKLVIVESPTKAKTISKFLGKDYQVESSYGHVRDLPKSKLGIDTEKNFEPQYIIPIKARKVVNQLKKSAQKAEEVVLATDEDREGEAIAWHLSQALNLKTKEKTERIVFHEITKSAIDKALTHPRKIDFNLVDAQQARRVLDRLVGYKLSPFLWKKITRGLSAGRVQSVALRLIVERENEIRAFKPEEYWSIVVKFANGLEAELVVKDKFDIKNKDEAEKIVDALKKAEFKVSAINKKEVNRNPHPPFITSTLQQEASKQLGFSAKKTMLLAQRLYEHGFITYMRTDSVNLSQEALVSAKEFISEKFGNEYATEAPRVFQGKSRLAQEAHEAIRPTHIGMEPEKIEVDDGSAKKLYKLIWQRFTASQMPQAKIAATTIEIVAGDYILRAAGQQLIFDGFLKVWPQKLTEKELQDVKEGDNLKFSEIVPSQHFTEPPARYSEATLIKALEDHGIGRPSTYAPTISVIQLRNYVEKEQRRFKPTEIGELVNKVLTEHFPNIVDIGFTAKMEENLDNVAEGKEKWQEVIKEFYEPFEKNLEEKYQEVSKKELVKEEVSDEKCEKCGKPMIFKFGRFGKFLACSGFPDCKSTKQVAKEPPKSTGLKCPKCGEGEIVERRVSRGRARGKIFWGCSRYPKCDHATWENPTEPQSGKKEEPAEQIQDKENDKEEEN